MITFHAGFMLVFLMLLWSYPFFQKSNCFWYGFVLRLFCVLLFLLRFYNSLQKNKLSSFELGLSGLGTVGFLFLVMLLFYNLWCLVSCVG